MGWYTAKMDQSINIYWVYTKVLSLLKTRDWI